jgi:hypothetical protein
MSAAARPLACVRADAGVLPPGNFIMDATVRPSHGRLSGYRPTIRPSVIVRVTTLLTGMLQTTLNGIDAHNSKHQCRPKTKSTWTLHCQYSMKHQGCTYLKLNSNNCSNPTYFCSDLPQQCIFPFHQYTAVQQKIQV